MALFLISGALVVGFGALGLRQIDGGSADDAATRLADVAPIKHAPSARTASPEIGSGGTALALTAAAPILATPSLPPRTLAPRQACDFIRARTRHVGEDVRFWSEFVVDHRGVAAIRPVGCKELAGVAAIGPSALRRLDQADTWSSQRRRLIGEVTARFVQSGGRAGGVGGLRLNISTVRNVQAVEPAPTPWPLARVVMGSPAPPGTCKTCSDVPY